MSFKYLFCIIVTLSSISPLSAQKTIEIESIYSSSHSILEGRFSTHFFHKNFKSFGLKGKIIFKDGLYISSGIFNNRYGSTIEIPDITLAMPAGTGGVSDLHFITKTVSIPLIIGCYLLDAERIRIGTDLGVSNAFVTSSIKEFTFLNFETDNPYGSNFLLFVNYGIDFNIKLASKVHLTLHPYLHYQINNADRQIRIVSHGIDFGLGYRLK